MPDKRSTGRTKGSMIFIKFRDLNKVFTKIINGSKRCEPCRYQAKHRSDSHVEVKVDLIRNLTKLRQTAETLTLFT